jgi:hypothetical protein
MTCQKSHRSNGTFSHATPPTRIKHLTEYMSTLSTLYLFLLINKAKLRKKKTEHFYCWRVKFQVIWMNKVCVNCMKN